MAEYDFNIKQGADWSWELTDFDEDISSDSFFMQIRADKDKTSTLILDVTPYLTISNNTLTCFVSSNVTSNLDFSKGHYDLFRIDLQSNTTELISGCVFLKNQISDLGGS